MRTRKQKLIAAAGRPPDLRVRERAGVGGSLGRILCVLAGPLAHVTHEKLVDGEYRYSWLTNAGGLGGSGLHKAL